MSNGNMSNGPFYLKIIRKNGISWSKTCSSTKTGLPSSISTEKIQNSKKKFFRFFDPLGVADPTPLGA